MEANMRILYLLILAFCLVTGAGAKASQTDKALLDKIQNAYGQINSFEAQFEQNLKHQESGTQEKRAGTIKFQKPLLIHWQTKKPAEEYLVINNKEIWNYIPDEEIAYRYNPAIAQDSRSIIRVITGQAKLDQDFRVKVAARENGMVKLALFPKDPTPQLVEAAAWVDPDTGVIYRASVTDFYGNVNDINFQSFKPGQKFAASQFNFKPPKGIEIEDRIKEPIQERELFRK